MILLSFDIEEFDLPTEYGHHLSFEEQIRVSSEGTRKILACLRKHQIKATFFCTANFALHATSIIEEILAEKHEIASHGYYHSFFDVTDLKKSKEVLEQITGLPIHGYRMARMMSIPEKEIYNAGYLYDSSLNPTYIPGRYNNFTKPRTYFYQDDVLQLPASVTPIVRFPLFWLACHNLAGFIFRWLALCTLKHDKYLNIYFHPWEFTNLHTFKDFKLPYIITNHSGEGMIKRLDQFILYFKKRGYAFDTIHSFKNEIESVKSAKK